ncbi:gpB bacteriophage P2 [Yersinia frederiksenii]|nr:gpB bacteriophage P2 [Yersinia frederiksenii]CNI04605.1 gpB bacteriophage P2 [Yersinia frederiksenii]
MLQLTEAEKLRMTGIARITEFKEKYLRNRKNVAQEAFDKSPAHLRKTICFHAGLKSRHVNMQFSELSPTERESVVEALNYLIEFTRSLPPFISNDDCTLNIIN